MLGFPESAISFGLVKPLALSLEALIFRSFIITEGADSL
jgi:hypothetical protein